MPAERSSPERAAEGTLAETLRDVWRAVLVDGRGEVEVDGVARTVGRTRGQGLRVVSFTFRGHAIDGIEQNPSTRSRWAELARAGERVMQFSSGHRYVANVAEGQLTRYPAWKALGLPE